MNSLLPVVAFLISAMSIVVVLSYRDMTAKERIFGSLFGLGWAAAGTYVWQVAAPSYSDATKPKIVLVWITVGSGLLLWWIAETRARKMAFWQFVLLGAGLGSLAGVVVWLMFYTADPPTAATITTTPPPPKQTSVDSADDIPLTLRLSNAVIDAKIAELRNVVITNKSNRGMSLSFILHLRYAREDGTSFHERYGANWDADASVIAFLSVIPGIKQADGVAYSNPADCVLEIRERVSGKRVGCTLIYGYPPAFDIPFNPIVFPNEGDWFPGILPKDERKE
jgi:hypothetical protein